ncbi:MAG: hypothetical protein WDZ62_02450 [Candidatus Pacearchaeota archaeon]
MFRSISEVMNNPEAWAFGGLLAIGIFLAVIISLAVYIYFAFAWYTIAKKKKHDKPWLAWIPFANISLWLQMGGFHWAWVFLFLIPILGWLAIYVLFIISTWRVFESLKYPGWLSLSPLLDIIAGGAGTIAYGIVVGIVAWKDNRKDKKSKKKKRK